MLNIENSTILKFNHQQLERISSELTSKEIDLNICDNETIQKYNALYRGKNSSTDVLSFPLDDSFLSTESKAHIPLGSIVISADYVINLSDRLNHSHEDELSLLFIHGLLHLLGYDHEIDNGEMREIEKELIKKFNLPKSLIIRMEKS